MRVHGCMTMPMAQVMRPPVRKLMRRGERLEKSLAGETTLAATFTLSVAISKAIIARTTAKGFPRRARTATGFQSASPKMMRVTEVTAMPMKPEKEETDCRTGPEIRPRRGECHDHGVDGLAADPGLNAEPAAGNESAQNGGNVGAENSEGGARKNREWDAVLRAGMRVEQHGNQYQDVTEKNGEERLLPIHAAGEHAAGEHVGRNVHDHGQPQSCVVVGAARGARAGDRGKVFVIERTALDGFGAKQFSWPPRSFRRRGSA